MKRSTRSSCALSLAMLAFAAGAQGCWEDGCDPGQLLVDNVCVAAPSTAMDAGADGDADAERDAATDPGVDAAALGFGAACATDDDCPAPTDFCARPLGEPSFCTRQGCDDERVRCPDGWECKDLSKIFPALPHACEPSPGAS